MRRKKSPQIRSEDVATFLPGFADMGTSQKLLRSKSDWSKEKKKKEQQHNGQITSTNLSTNWNLFVKKIQRNIFVLDLDFFCLKLISFKPAIAPGSTAKVNYFCT